MPKGNTTMREASKLATAELKKSEGGDTKEENVNNDSSSEEAESKPSEETKEPSKDTKSKEGSKKTKEAEDSSKEEETPDQGGEEEDTGQSGSEESEESFTSGFKPDELPEKLKPAYKEMQADYTRKTQALAEKSKEFERLQRFSPLLNRVLSNPQLLAQATGQAPQGQATPQSGAQPQAQQEEIPQDPQQYADWVEQRAIRKFQQMQANRERVQAQRQQKVQDFKQAEQLDSRLNEDKQFQDVVFGLVSANDDFRNGRVSATEATKQAIQDYDAHTEQIKKSAQESYKEKLNKQTQNKRNVDKSGSDSAANASQSGKAPQTMREAWKLAQQEQSA